MQKSKLQLKIQNCFLTILVILVMYFTVLPVFAAEIYFKADSTTVRPGDYLEVLVLLNTENEDINAVEGVVLFPEDILEAKDINEANSILTFWPEKPGVYNGNKIKFTGITPGGYQEKTGLLFSITFQAKKEGAGIIEIKDSRVLLNDGEGTPTSVKLSPFQFSVSQEAPAAPLMVETVKDTDPPEEFKPEIARDQTLFDGKWFLVFVTQDKGSGIDHYEIQENRKQKIENRNWEMAESPYVLRDQKLNSYIYVKAVDKSGNERIAELPPQNPLEWYENYLIWIIIIGGGVIGYIICRILWLKFCAKK